MQETTQTPEPQGVVTKRSLGWAGAAAFLACAACCALPLLAVAGGSTLATLATWLTPGLEPYAALTAGLGTLAFFALRTRRARGCETACSVDRSCCDQSSEQGRAT